MGNWGNFTEPGMVDDEYFPSFYGNDPRLFHFTQDPDQCFGWGTDQVGEVMAGDIQVKFRIWKGFRVETLD